jgi:hypothetical protein
MEGSLSSGIIDSLHPMMAIPEFVVYRLLSCRFPLLAAAVAGTGQSSR